MRYMAEAALQLQRTASQRSAFQWSGCYYQTYTAEGKIILERFLYRSRAFERGGHMIELTTISPSTG